MNFDLKITDPKSKARAGVITTDHGVIETPIFMPVGTVGTVKGVHQTELKTEVKPDIILANTYHLYLRPKTNILEQAGGIHKFMNWDRNILTDSGGYQVYSLSGRRKIEEEGVKFKSHIDGSLHNLTPEYSMEIQRLLGSDIVMSFDECTPFPATEKQAKSSMDLSMRWAQRSRDAFGDRPGYALFGIQQGSTFKDMREESAEKLTKIGFDGYAVGGLAVGEGQDLMFEVLEYAPNQLPQDKPRYLMGVGKPDDIVGAVQRGIDMFDCVLPSRSGRTGQALTRRGAINMRNSRHRDDQRPLDETCECPCCKNYSRAYIHHVHKAGEIISSMLLTWHNLHYYQILMSELRDAIATNSLDAYVAEFHAIRKIGDIEPI